MFMGLPYDNSQQPIAGDFASTLSVWRPIIMDAKKGQHSTWASFGRFESIQRYFRRRYGIKVLRMVRYFCLIYHHDKGNADSGLIRTNLENDEGHSVKKTACN
jgi:hypothetical protein